MPSRARIGAAAAVGYDDGSDDAAVGLRVQKDSLGLVRCAGIGLCPVEAGHDEHLVRRDGERGKAAVGILPEESLAGCHGRWRQGSLRQTAGVLSTYPVLDDSQILRLAAADRLDREGLGFPETIRSALPNWAFPSRDRKLEASCLRGGG